VYIESAKVFWTLNTGLSLRYRVNVGKGTAVHYIYSSLFTITGSNKKKKKHHKVQATT